MNALAYVVTPVAAVSFGAAARGVGERRPFHAVLGVLRGVVALWIGYGLREPAQENDPELATWAAVGMAISIAGFLLATRDRDAPRLRLSWTAVALADALTLTACLVISGAVPFGPLLLACIPLAATPLVLAVRTWQQTRGAWRSLALLYLLGPLLFAGAFGLPAFGYAGLLFIRALVLIEPVVVLCLIPEPEPLGAARIAAALGTCALIAQAIGLYRHVERCAGDLIPVAAPDGWKDLPELAQGGETSLGPFSLRYQRDSYKGYPAPFVDMRLGDKTLCFACSLSLDAWFGRPGEAKTRQPSMYRHYGELRLRRDVANDVYIVSAVTYDQQQEMLAAFHRTLRRAIRFDNPYAAASAALGAALFALGVAWALRGRHRAALIVLLVALFEPLAFDVGCEVVDAPRPGHEVRGGDGFIG